MRLSLWLTTTCLAGAVSTGAGTALIAQDSAQQPRTALEVAATGVKTFYADRRAGNNQVTIFSEAPLEDFTSVCNRIGGSCTLDPQRVESFKGQFHLDVKDIDTGIDLRNGHLAGPDWLDAKKYPKIVIDFDRVEDVTKSQPNGVSMTLIGTCTLHGVARPIRITSTLIYLDESPRTMRRVKGDLIRLRASFDIKLSDFDITGPPGADTVGLKVAETVRIRATLFGSTEKPAEELKVDRPESGKEQRRSPPKRPAPKRPAPVEPKG